MRPVRWKCLLMVSAMALVAPSLRAWHDKTHVAMAQASGYDMWFNAAAPDLAKEKAKAVESYNHYFNNNQGEEVTVEMVLNQVEHYNDPKDGEEGHLLGAIVGALREYQDKKDKGKYAQYPLAYAAHYLGDLSMPFHNMPYDDFNKAKHTINDGIVEQEVLSHVEHITQQMYPLTFSDRRELFEQELAREIARVANLSRRLGEALKMENRNMRPDEVYVQLGHSASLFKAILAHFHQR